MSSISLPPTPSRPIPLRSGGEGVGMLIRALAAPRRLATRWHALTILNKCRWGRASFAPRPSRAPDLCLLSLLAESLLFFFAPLLLLESPRSKPTINHRFPRASLSSPRILSSVCSWPAVTLPHMRLLAPELKTSAVGIARTSVFDTGLEPSIELLSLDWCQGCCSLRGMSSMPQSAHAAAKVHHVMMMAAAEGRDWSSNASGNAKDAYEKDAPNPWILWVNQFLDHPLAKYNSKMMNSIWGLYNRYSVHNFKRVTEEGLKGKGGEWMTAPSSFTLNQKLQAAQPNQSGPYQKSISVML
ncbi:uncharacterized protein LOC124163249 isoform X2 [Ischnura elegans]|uniref:uncharacterized protein LOC124163249 isoform X2 n=1 Tax=Ischnura elegans TaxID=197161 RepID=UPI001ED8B985|nr:uncharacterized protein LOC124163249 isoform X2 [Ischnura elegans]